jgi:hypothetical protein
MGASVCPEAVASQASELKQINTCSRLAVSRRLCCVATQHGGTAPWLQLGLVVETVEDLIFGVTWLRRLRVATFAKPTAGQGSVKPSKRFTTVQSRTTSLELVLIQKANLVEIYLQNI